MIYDNDTTIDAYTHAMDAVKLSPDKKDEMRTAIFKSGQRRKRKLVIAGSIAAAVIIFAVVMGCIPTVRISVYAAVERVITSFRTADGHEFTYGSDENSMYFNISVTTNADGYTEVTDGRIYFVLGDIREDITDKCSESTYFRYEVSHDDGSRSVILIGGTPDNCGWIELVFDSNGDYTFNQMNISEDTPAWADIAMSAEGVPTGNAYYDDESAHLSSTESEQ